MYQEGGAEGACCINVRRTYPFTLTLYFGVSLYFGQLQLLRKIALAGAVLCVSLLAGTEEVASLPGHYMWPGNETTCGPTQGCKLQMTWQ